MSKGPNGKAVFLLMLITAMGAGALAVYVKTTPEAARVPDELRRPEPNRANESGLIHPSQPTPKPPVSNQLTVRLPHVDGEKVTLVDSKPVPDGTDPKVFVADQIVETFHATGVHTLGVEVRDGTAFINFSEGIDKGFGSMEEGSFLKSLQLAYGQFADVKNLRLEQNGTPLDSLGGHIELTDPVPVIRNGQPVDDKPGVP